MARPPHRIPDHALRPARPVPLLTPPDIVRLIRHLTTPRRPSSNACWLWTGYRDAKGYGQIRIGGRSYWVHRVAYTAFIGPIPDGEHVDHTCGHPACCNPRHLRHLPLTLNSISRHRHHLPDPAIPRSRDGTPIPI